MMRSGNARRLPVPAIPRPRRPQEHVNASLSENYVENFIYNAGHVVKTSRYDYGTDLFVETCDKRGYMETGFFRMQLKASKKPKYSKDGSYISFDVERKHYNLWIAEEFPVFLVMYDVKQSRAYYLYMQEYFENVKKPKKTAKSIAVRIPVKQKFTKNTLDVMRRKKLAVQKQMRIKHG
jgi:uncharacterized protein DUF4365